MTRKASRGDEEGKLVTRKTNRGGMEVKTNRGLAIEAFRDLLHDGDAIVCGTGPTFYAAVGRGVDLEPYWTFAVNSAVEVFRPDFALCFESVKHPMWTAIFDSSAAHFFGNTLWPSDVPRVARFTMLPTNPVGHYSWSFLREVGQEVGDLSRGRMTPWWAVLLAVFMGCRTVGLLGVDIHGHSTFDSLDVIPEIEEEWASLRDCAERLGSRIVSLSPGTKLQAIPQGSWSELRLARR